MTTAELEMQLIGLKAHKAPRVELANKILNHRLLNELLDFASSTSKVSHQACWVLEQCYLKDEQACYEHLEVICGLLTQSINTSGMRSLCKIAFLICKKYYSVKAHKIKELLNTSMQEDLIEGLLDQLLTRHGKTANLAFATRALYLLGNDQPWIHEQLPALIHSHWDHPENPGYRSVAKQILKKLQQ